MKNSEAKGCWIEWACSAQRHEGDGLGGSDVTGASRVSLCQECLSHCGHFMKEKVRGRPAAFQRIPPSSQIDRAKPHEHRIIHERESASMLSAHRRGRMRTKNVWRGDMNVERRRTITTQGRAGMDAQPETWMLSARSLE